MYLKKIWFILSREHKTKGVILLFFILISTLLEVLGIGLIVPMILFLIEDNILIKYPFLFETVSYFFDQPNKINLIKFGLGALLSVYFVKNLFLALFSYYESKFAWGVRADISERLFKCCRLV